MPLSRSSRARSRAAPSSSFSTACDVMSTGVPCGMVTDAAMTSASMEGKKWKLIHPPRTMPPVRIRVESPTAAVTYRQRSAVSSSG